MTVFTAPADAAQPYPDGVTDLTAASEGAGPGAGACSVCGGATSPFAEATVLQRHRARFVRCAGCGLILTPDPYWLDEAYASPIWAGDEGLLHRSLTLSRVTAAVIRSERLRGGRFLDWAGGLGVLTRLMRDRGLDFTSFDAYAENLLAAGYDGDETVQHDLVTAFEVVEHLTDPAGQLATVAQTTDLLLFTTVLQPPTPPRPDCWWYYQLDSGQHVALHTRRSLETLGQRLGYRLTTNGQSLHLFHRRDLHPTTRALLSPGLVWSRDAVRRVIGRQPG